MARDKEKILKYLLTAQDESNFNGPKNETLAEHRKHCEAEPGNCPFEKKLDECDTEIGKRDKKMNGNGVTPAEDAEYADAVKSGDRETALRMIREAAAKAMPNTKVVDKDGLPLVVWHGGNFATSHDNNIPDLTEGEMHFGSKKAAQERVAYKYATIEDSAKVNPYFLNLENPKKVGDIGGASSTWLDWSNLTDRIHDGIVYKNDSEDEGSISYGVSWDPNRIKSADITYDDAGNLIPLSKRFDYHNNDIRY